MFSKTWRELSCWAASPLTHLAVLKEPIKDRAVSLAGKTHVEASQLRHVLFHVVGANVFYEVDVICETGINSQRNASRSKCQSLE